MTLDGSRALALRTDRGTVDLRYYPAKRSHKAVVWLGDASRGFPSPALGLYQELGQGLTAEGLGSLRVDYRRPGKLDECVLDALASLAFLTSQTHPRLALVGHGFGAAVALQAAAGRNDVATVIALAPQARGTEAAAALDPGCALLVVQAGLDPLVPGKVTEQVYARARGDKRLTRLEGAGHDLDEAGTALRLVVESWLREHLLLPEPLPEPPPGLPQ